jgi:hypothetical protein
MDTAGSLLLHRGGVERGAEEQPVVAAKDGVEQPQQPLGACVWQPARPTQATR